MTAEPHAPAPSSKRPGLVQRLQRMMPALWRRRQAALLSAQPDPWFLIDEEGARCDPRLSSALGGAEPDGVEALCAALGPAGAGLRAALAEGREAELTLMLAGAPHRVAVARPWPGAMLLTFRDAGAEFAAQARAEAAERRAAAAEAALDALPVPLWQRGSDLSLCWANAAYAALAEAPAAAVVPEQRELTSGVNGGGRGLAVRAKEAGRAETDDVRLSVEGSRRVLRITEVPLPDGGLVGCAVDQTAAEEARSELQRHLGAHAEVLEQIGVAIAVWGPDKRLAFYNAAYVRLWGLEEAWLDDGPTMAQVLEELRSRRRLPEQADFAGFKRQQTAQFSTVIGPTEDAWHLPDGSTLRVVTTPHPFGGLLSTFEDVSHTLALESSYNTLIAVQRETLDNLAEGLAVYGSDGRLKLTNPAFQRIWQLQARDLAGEPHAAEVMDRIRRFFPHGDDWEGTREDLVANALERTPRSGRLVRTDGAVIDFSIVPLPDGAVLNSYLDVSDSVRVEQALRASNAALEAADRLKAEFLANVSYQLRTPLNAIMGFTEVLANEYFGELNERQRGYCANILDASGHLLGLIDDILDLASIEAGRLTLTHGVVQVQEVLRSVHDLVEAQAQKQSLTLEVDCPADIGVLEADELRLKQAIYNLASNALKFTPPGGSILLAARRGEEWVTLSVTDTGVGIAQADQSRIFGLFERADPQARASGAGLGLALVKRIVELHGGHVDLTSAPGRGTTVSCVLPVRADTAVRIETGF